MQAIEVTGTLLRTLRASHGLTLRYLARESGYTHGHLSKVEFGQRPAAPSVVAAYSRVLAVDIRTLAVDGSPIDDALRAALVAERERLRARLAVLDGLLALRTDP